MAEVDQNLVQQLEANLAAFEGAGLTDQADSTRAKLEQVRGGDDKGTGPYEDRTKAELQEVLKSQNKPTSGSKDELIARLRGEE